MRSFLLLLFITMALLVCSCVGTIQSKKPVLSKGSVTGNIVLTYEGIKSAVAISHDKVEITFPAMPGDLNGEYTYIVQYNSANSPTYFKSNELQDSKDEFNNFKVTIYDLNINTSYNFSVQVTDTKGNSSNNTKVLEASTFANETADFLGISALNNLTGIDGAYGIRVDWVAATKTGLIVPDMSDVSKYEVKIVEDPLTPATFDDPAYDGPKKKTVLINSDKINAVINGLKPDTSYYVRVRAIHYGYDTYKLDLSYQREKNSKSKKIKTYSLSASNITVQPTSFIAASTNSSSSLDLSWLPAGGPFLNYRVYYADLMGATAWSTYSQAFAADCSSTIDVSGWRCKSVPTSAVTSIITDLTAYKDYQIALVACGNISCSTNQKYNVVSAAPAPPMATFTGISVIESPRAYYSLDTIYLKFSPPDFSSGIISGVFVKFMGRSNVNPIEPACVLNDSSQSCVNTSKYAIASFDFKTDSEVAVTGIDPNSVEPYCFKMIPFVEKGTGIEMAPEENYMEKCIVPTIDIPNPIQFTGLISATKDTNNYIALEWTPPSGGIFTEYNIYVRTDQNPFSFTEAIADDPNYVKITLPFGYPTQVNGNIIYTLGPINLAGGQTASFGVLVSKPDGTQKQYSQNFSNVRTITW